MKLIEYMGAKVTDDVCCNKCYKLGLKPKPEIEAGLAIRVGGFKNLPLSMVVILEFWNGLVFKIPLCCNIYYRKLIFKRVRPAIVAATIRGDGYIFKNTRLTRKEVAYIENSIFR
jgi:hypothetical protein